MFETFRDGATERSTWTCSKSDTFEARGIIAQRNVLDCAFYLICALRNSPSTNSIQFTRISIKTIKRNNIRDIGKEEQIWGYRKCQDRMRSK